MIALEWILVCAVVLFVITQAVLPILFNQRLFPLFRKPAKADAQLDEAEAAKIEAGKHLQAEVIKAEARYAEKKADEIKDKIK